MVLRDSDAPLRYMLVFDGTIGLKPLHLLPFCACALCCSESTLDISYLTSVGRDAQNWYWTEQSKFRVRGDVSLLLRMLRTCLWSRMMWYGCDFVSSLVVT